MAELRRAVGLPGDFESPVLLSQYVHSEWVTDPLDPYMRYLGPIAYWAARKRLLLGTGSRRRTRRT